MTVDELIRNIQEIKKITRELYVFSNQLDAIKNLEITGQGNVKTKEKNLLIQALVALTNQLRILNNTIPTLVKSLSPYKRLKPGEPELPKEVKKLTKVRYHPVGGEKISLTIEDEDKKDFLDNLSKSHLSIGKLKKDYAVDKKPMPTFGKPNQYAKWSNKYFRNNSNSLIAKGYFNKLNKDLRKMNSPFVVGTYVSMILFTMCVGFIASILFFIFLLFFNMSAWPPFFTLVEENILLRAVKTLWIIVVIPLSLGILMYFYPSSESRSLGAKINQELPFVTIHMSAIATSGVEPLSIFKIILKSKDYKYTNIEFKKLMNLVNFHGKDLVTALKKTSRASPSIKLRELLDGLATTITSGGNLHQFLEKHAENLLFDHRLEREKYTKTSETFMDIYISIVIAAPMILLMLFVIMGSTGMLINFLGLTLASLSLLIILAIIALNIGFIVFLKIKQPAI